MAKRLVAAAAERRKKNKGAPQVDVRAALGVLFGLGGVALGDLPVSPVTCRLEMRTTGQAFSILGPVPPVSVWPVGAVTEIQLTVDLTPYPFAVLGGSIGGDIFTAQLPPWSEIPPALKLPANVFTAVGTTWKVAPGGFLGDQLFVEFVWSLTKAQALQRSAIGGIRPQSSILILGHLQPPDTYAASYTFDGGYATFPARILFKGWQPGS